MSIVQITLCNASKASSSPVLTHPTPHTLLFFMCHTSSPPIYPRFLELPPTPTIFLVEEFAPKLRRLSHKMCVCVVNLCVSVCVAPIQRQMDIHTHTDPHTHTITHTHHHRSINPLRVLTFVLLVLKYMIINYFNIFQGRLQFWCLLKQKKRGRKLGQKYIVLKMLKISKFSGEWGGKMVITAKTNFKVIYIFVLLCFFSGNSMKVEMC